MLTGEENDRLTRIGAETPMGALFRRYWHPIAGMSELDDEPTKAIRVLGEDLVVYKDRRGHLGLLGLHCPHRKASLEYGIPELNGLRCCYHGWLFDAQGKCLDQPAELPTSKFKEHIQHTAYPVEELGGLIWAYLGPEPAPLLPRYDILVDDGGLRDIATADVPCNWLQCMENSVDMTHVENLHGRYNAYVLERLGRPARPSSERVGGGRKHVRMGFSLNEHGIVKHRIFDGDGEEADSWQEGQGFIVFPNMTIAGGFQIRVPIDDFNTRLFLYSFYRPKDGGPVPPQDRVPIYNMPYMYSNGKFMVDGVTRQDTMVMTTQGPVMDRTDERLGASDEGLVFYRKVLTDQIEVIERGEDPLGVMRSPTPNERIGLPRGKNYGTSARHMKTHWGENSPIYEEIRALVKRGSGDMSQAIEENSNVDRSTAPLV